MSKHDCDDTVVISQCNQSNSNQKRRILTQLVNPPDVALDYIVQYAATHVLVTRVFDATCVPIPFQLPTIHSSDQRGPDTHPYYSFVLLGRNFS